MNEALPNYEKCERPWGNFERFTQNENTTVKIITLNAGQRFSLQKHAQRSEFWRVLSGSGIVTVGEKEGEAVVGSEFFIPKETLHRAQAGSEGLRFLEIAFGEFNENDIVRISDDYGRV